MSVPWNASNEGCPYCTLKVFCKKHSQQSHSGQKQKNFGRPGRTRDPAVLDQLYRDLVESKLRRYNSTFASEEVLSDTKKASCFWHTRLEEKKSFPETSAASSEKNRRKKSRSVAKNLCGSECSSESSGSEECYRSGHRGCKHSSRSRRKSKAKKYQDTKSKDYRSDRIKRRRSRSRSGSNSKAR